MNLAKVALSLVALLVLAGCSSSYGPAPMAGGTACAPPPCDPCAPVVPLRAPWRRPRATPAVSGPRLPTPARCGATSASRPSPGPSPSRSASSRPPAGRSGCPPVTKDVCEQVCVQPESCRQIPIPAQYETVCEQVMVCPGKTEWRKVACEPHSLSEGEQLGECWTLAEIPPVYETRSRQVCTQPESCRQEIIPARYESQTKTVTVQEGYYKSIEVPAVYESRCREELVCPVPLGVASHDRVRGPRWRHAGRLPGLGARDAHGHGQLGMPMPDDGAMPLPPDDMMPPAGELPPADPFAR